MGRPACQKHDDRRPDGRCRACFNDNRARYRREHPEMRRSIENRYRAATAIMVNARNRLRAAVQRGVITRLPCELCGAEPAQAHHPFGYDGVLALAVWWLCHSHHAGLHTALKGR